MQLRIAICDDEKEICSQVEEYIRMVLRKKDITCETDIFQNGEALCDEMKRTRYDIVFLDIEMPGMSGVNVGKFIRENLQDEMTQITYISSKQQYAMELFEYRPLNFLIKPLTIMQMETLLNKYLRVVEHDGKIFTYSKAHNFYKLPLSQIIYFQSEARKVKIVTIDGEDYFYGSLNDVYSELRNWKFLYIHKSMIVNYKYIKKMGINQVTMVDGTEFSISQSKRKEIRMQYMEFMKEENTCSLS